MRTKLIAACVLTLAMTACLGGVASAKPSHAKAPIQQGNEFCGKNEPGLPTIGTVAFKRVGNVVTLKVLMKHGEPNKAYEILLYGNVPFCQGFGPVFTITTNKKGVAKGSGSTEVPPEETEFFADPWNGIKSDDTPYVKLP